LLGEDTGQNSHLHRYLQTSCFLSIRSIQDRVDDVIEVVELYIYATSVIKQQQSNKNYGIALCYFIDNTFA
jgi:hypothetical protein